MKKKVPSFCPVLPLISIHLGGDRVEVAKRHVGSLGRSCGGDAGSRRGSVFGSVKGNTEFNSIRLNCGLKSHCKPIPRADLLVATTCSSLVMKYLW